MKKQLSLIFIALMAWLSSSTAQNSFLRGGDLTMVTYIEDWGATFKYPDGTPDDVFNILQSYGVNLARLRLYNHPGTPTKDGNTTYRLPVRTAKHPNGYEYAGPQDILNLSKRAKEHNMQICLSFHLSDYWSNAGLQHFPKAWEQITSYASLKDSVTEFITHFMQRMVEQDTPPQFVSVGNETNYGILFGPNNQHASFGGYGDNITQWVGLFNAAYDAIKAVCPTAQVIFHHSYGHKGGINTCQWLFDELITKHKMKVDIIGGSYYPYWASLQQAGDDTPTGMAIWAQTMEKRYHKPIMIMETGYAWAQYNNPSRNGDNWEGQLHTNGSYGPAKTTPQGQADFMQALHDELQKNNFILGYLYWDPIFVDQQVNGQWLPVCWAEKQVNGQWYYDNNVVANTTWFDYTGKALPVLYETINRCRETQLPSLTSNRPKGIKTIHQGTCYIEYYNKKYSISTLLPTKL